MGFGSEKPKRNLFFVTLKTQDKDGPLRPHFKIIRYENKIKIDLPDETEIFGKLVKLGYETHTWKNEVIESILFYLVDGEQLLKVGVALDTMLGRSIMNTIAGTKIFEDFNMRVYITKPKDGKDPMPGVYITNNGQQTVWKYDYKKDLTPLITQAPDPKRRGVMVNVYHTVNDLLLKSWKETMPIVENHAKEMGFETINDKQNKPATSAEPESSFENTVNHETVENVDDLPF